MATKTVTVRGRYFDGCTEADAGYVAAKIADVYEAADEVIDISTFRQGHLLAATIVYVEAE